MTVVLKGRRSSGKPLLRINIRGPRAPPLRAIALSQRLDEMPIATGLRSTATAWATIGQEGRGALDANAIGDNLSRNAPKTRRCLRPRAPPSRVSVAQAVAVSRRMTSCRSSCHPCVRFTTSQARPSPYRGSMNARLSDSARIARPRRRGDTPTPFLSARARGCRTYRVMQAASERF